MVEGEARKKVNPLEKSDKRTATGFSGQVANRDRIFGTGCKPGPDFRDRMQTGIGYENRDRLRESGTGFSGQDLRTVHAGYVRAGYVPAFFYLSPKPMPSVILLRSNLVEH